MQQACWLRWWWDLQRINSYTKSQTALISKQNETRSDKIPSTSQQLDHIHCLQHILERDSLWYHSIAGVKVWHGYEVKALMQTLFFTSMAICTCGITFEIQGLCIFYSLNLARKHQRCSGLYGTKRSVRPHASASRQDRVMLRMANWSCGGFNNWQSLHTAGSIPAVHSLPSFACFALYYLFYHFMIRQRQRQQAQPILASPSGFIYQTCAALVD